MNETALVTDYRWDATPTTDRYRTIQFYRDPTLRTLSERGLCQAFGFASVKSLRNFLARAEGRGHITGEVGNLTPTAAWLDTLLFPPVEAPAAPLPPPAPRPTYPSDVRRNELRREQRNGHSDSARTTPSTPQGAPPDTPPRARDRIVDPESIRSFKNPESESNRSDGGVEGNHAPPIAPPLSIAEELMQVGFSREDAEKQSRRYRDTTPNCRDALDVLSMWREGGWNGDKPAAVVMSFLLKKRDIPPELTTWRRERAERARPPIRIRPPKEAPQVDFREVDEVPPDWHAHIDALLGEKGE